MLTLTASPTSVAVNGTSTLSMEVYQRNELHGVRRLDGHQGCQRVCHDCGIDGNDDVRVELHGQWR